MITILVVDNSPESRDLLCKIVRGTPEFKLVATASNGREAIAAAALHQPKVIIMDTEMPVLDGYETTRMIMETRPVPIIMLSDPSGLSKSDAAKAIAAGAVATIVKPVATTHPGYKNHSRHLVRTIKVMSEVKMVKRWAAPGSTPVTAQVESPTVNQAGVKVPGPPITQALKHEIADEPTKRAVRINSWFGAKNSIRFVVIGASTGGPPALRVILSQIPADFPASILIVQHIAPGFLDSMRSWLLETTGLDIRIASNGEIPLAGHIYLAPDGFQMRIDEKGRIVLTTDEPENGLRPSVSYLFRSIADYFPRTSVGVLLTGMGKDGADELQRMRSRGSVTIAQDEESSVVHGMPGEAIRLQAAIHILPADEIAAMLVELVMHNRTIQEAAHEEHHGS